MAINKKGMMFVLSSPSGVGKTTLTKKLAENNSQFVISISHTTRKPRQSEINGKDYHFVTSEEFNVLVKKAKGTKCPRCWIIFPGSCVRCDTNN